LCSQFTEFNILNTLELSQYINMAIRRSAIQFNILTSTYQYTVYGNTVVCIKFRFNINPQPAFVAKYVTS